MSRSVTQDTQIIAPRIRFATFSDSWEETQLNEIADFLKGNGLSKDDITEDGKNLCIRYGELYTDYKEVIRNIKSRTNKPKDECMLSKMGDILIPSSGETAIDISTACCVNENNIIVGGDLNILRLREGYSGEYFAYYLSNKKKKEIAKIAQGHSVVHLYASHLKKLKVMVPQFDEQQKIAGFLVTVDGWINNLRTQKKSFETYKKGMMQKIFSQEIRFKDDGGRDFPDWQEIPLKKILKERKEYSTKDNGYTHISLTKEGVVPKTDRYNRDFLVNDDTTKKYKITRLNDLCYNPANLKFGVISLNKSGNGIFSPIYVTFEIIEQNVDFIAYYLTRDTFINKARKYEQGTVYERMAVSPSDFLKVKVSMPLLKEQLKIANYFKLLDSMISVKIQQIEQAEVWKKGLIQELYV